MSVRPYVRPGGSCAGAFQYHGRQRDGAGRAPARPGRRGSAGAAPR